MFKINKGAVYCNLKCIIRLKVYFVLCFFIMQKSLNFSELMLLNNYNIGFI